MRLGIHILSIPYLYPISISKYPKNFFRIHHHYLPSKSQTRHSSIPVYPFCFDEKFSLVCTHSILQPPPKSHIPPLPPRHFSHSHYVSTIHSKASKSHSKRFCGIIRPTICLARHKPIGGQMRYNLASFCVCAICVVILGCAIH